MARRWPSSGDTVISSDFSLLDSVSSPIVRKYPQRRPISRRRALPALRISYKHSETRRPSRPILVPVHLNLRPLPSREDKLGANVSTGSKRKRAYSTSEGARKRIRSSSSDDLDMEMNAPPPWSTSRDEGSDEDSAEFYINKAPASQLHRLRKDHLIRLFTIAGLQADPDSCTKSDLVNAIVAARDDDEPEDVPPSSPQHSSDYSSDGHLSQDDDADAEDDGPAPKRGVPLTRRATIHVPTKSSRYPAYSRSFSMGNVSRSGAQPPVDDSKTESSRRRPISPHVTRLHTRTMSEQSQMSVDPGASRTNSSAAGPVGSKRSKRKGKWKQVEFNDILVQIPKTLSSQWQGGRPIASSESDLTEISDGDLKSSPRRLRSKDKENSALRPASRGVFHGDTALSAKRVTPMRKAKTRIKSLKEESDSCDDGDQDGTDEDEVMDGDDAMEEDELVEEVDELASFASMTTPPHSARSRGQRRMQTTRSLRSRQKQPDEHANDGDDECESEAEADELVDDVMDTEDNENTGSVTPRRLRNGKVVGQNVEEDDDDETETLTNDSDDEASVDLEVHAAEDDMADEEDSDGTALPPEKGPEPEVIDLTLDCDSENEEVDLGSATCRSLVRLRRAQLVELCAKRGLDVQGTKPQLADALIVWRDEHGHDSDADDIRGHWRSQRREFSSSSSQGTVRPPSTTTPTKRTRHRRMTNDAESLPVLLRSHHVHMDEPLTPLVNDAQKSRKSSGRKADAEPAELELDLESLGLEDREIPPDKLQKLEKIGSGGFKDVFIGKLKGRKIAIAEFRGPLSDMDIKELKLLGGFNHPNIVKFLGVSIPENRRDTPVMMISELCSNGDLFDYVRNVDSPSLYRVLHMMLDIASGLEYLHLCKPSVIHRDCKSSNILITAKGVAKIADFGLAKVKQSTRSMVRSLVGTVNWQAPELWHAHPKYDHKVDVFSCGMVYWEMLQWCLSKEERKYPWEGMNEHAIYEEVGQKLNRPSTDGLRKAWCPEIVDLMETMWAQDPRDRPTMSQVVITVRELVQHHRRR